MMNSTIAIMSSLVRLQQGFPQAARSRLELVWVDDAARIDVRIFPTGHAHLLTARLGGTGYRFRSGWRTKRSRDRHMRLRLLQCAPY
jgi:hypothetical protein